MAEESFIFKGAVTLLYFLKWQEIVDNYSVRNAKHIQIHGVNSVLVCLVVSVEEYFLEAPRLLGESTGGSHIPAVTNDPLPHVERCDSIVTPEWISWEFIGSALP